MTTMKQNVTNRVSHLVINRYISYVEDDIMKEASHFFSSLVLMEDNLDVDAQDIFLDSIPLVVGRSRIFLFHLSLIRKN